MGDTRAQQSENQGEGDKASAKRFNEAEQAFVQSPAGREAVEHVGEEDAATQAEDRAAERATRARAKEEDPAVMQRPGRGAEDRGAGR